MRGPTEAQTRQWQEDGFLVFPGAIAGEQLQRLQRAFDHWAERCKADWLDRIDRGEQAATYYDIPDPLDKDEIFIDIVDHPSYFGCLSEFTGGQPIVLAEQVRTVPPWPFSYTSWHPDVPHSNPLHIKVQIYVNDVAPGRGEFAFVPGSHKRSAGPYTRPLRQESMPGYRTFTGAAGTAVMFNARGWHAAMDNHGGTPRKSIILIYEQRTAGRVDAGTFSSIAHLCTTPERRRLFSLEQ
ncbi:MAG: phytanoyl-CoA dioxygenase family protein [Spirochaetaceae bacterium]|nr:phytanoyl-CoA dioxygenase family protein [Spirochaetaceae bacterium]